MLTFMKMSDNIRLLIALIKNKKQTVKQLWEMMHDDEYYKEYIMSHMGKNVLQYTMSMSSEDNVFVPEMIANFEQNLIGKNWESGRVELFEVWEMLNDEIPQMEAELEKMRHNFMLGA